MSFTYDNTNLSTGTDAGRLNVVRLLIGDVSSDNPRLQDEEIQFALSETNNKVYLAGAWCCETLAAKYSTQVDIRLDEELEAKYSQLFDQFSRKAIEMREMSKRFDGGSALGIRAGGIDKDTVKSVQEDLNRLPPAFREWQFQEGGEVYDPPYY